MQPQSFPQYLIHPLFELGAELRFHSTQEALLRYKRLHELFGAPRSIPLGKDKTWVSRTDRHGTWQSLRQEFAALCCCFPQAETLEWHVLMLSTLNLMPWQRLDILEQITGERYSRWALSKAEDEATGNLAAKLRAHGYLA